MKRLILAFALMMMLSVPAGGTVSETSCTTTSACNGSSTAFTFDFPIVETGDLVVILRTVADGSEQVLTETADYSVSATNNDYSSGGTVTTVSTYSSAYSLTVLRDTPATQEADLEDTGVLRLESIEDELDKLTMLVQQLQEEFDRSIKIPRSDTSITTMVDDSVNRASRWLGFDSEGNVSTASAISTGSVSVSSFMEGVLDDANADAAKTTLEIPTISSFAETVLDDANAPDARTTLGAVGLTGDETVAGTKTFTGNNIHSGVNTLGDSSQLASSAAPTADADIANKKYVDDSHKPYARMYVNAAQNNLTDATWTTITLDTDTFDSGTITDTSNYKITPAVAGYYLVIGQVTFTNVIAEKTYAAQLYVNGSTVKKITYMQNGAATTDVSAPVTDVIYFDSDDYVQLRGYVNCGAATVDINTGTEDTNLVLYRL